MSLGTKTPRELDEAAARARRMTERVLFSLKLGGFTLDPNAARTVTLRETMQGVLQDDLLFGE